LRRIAQQLALVLCGCALAGCIERLDYEPATASTANQSGQRWELAGEFGGDALPANNAVDPWERRFQPGGFKLVSGVCATDDEVWVCDLGISRIQIFSFDGTWIRSIGAGVPIEGTLPTLQETLDEFNDPGIEREERWEATHGEPWRSRRFELFRIADVIATDDGYWAADWARTSSYGDAWRDFQVYFKPFNGDYEPVEIHGMCFPEYLAATPSRSDVAVSSSTTTALWTMYRDGGMWKQTQLNPGIAFARYMLLNQAMSDSPDYTNIYARQAGAGRDAGEFFLNSGIAIAFRKLLVCDTGNRRLQVVNIDRSRPESQGEIARVIHARDNQGRMRFAAPLDIDVDSTGRSFILDAERHEVAILDTEFNRIGSFGKGRLLEPYAIDLSDDGLHCFISDRRFNKVLHYARSE